MAVLMLAACTTIVRPAYIQIPAAPVLVKVPGSELMCLAPATYLALADRQAALLKWALELQAALQGNNAKALHSN